VYRALIYQDGVEIGNYSAAFPLAGWGQTFPPFSAVIFPAQGVHTYTLKINRETGSGSGAIQGIDYLMVEDISGGQGGPGPILLGKTENFGNQQDVNTATPTDITGATLTINVPAGRSIRLRARTHLSVPAGGNTRARVYIQEGAAVLGGSYIYLTGGSYGEELHVEKVITPTPGEHTYKLTLSRDVGANAVRVYSGSDSMTYLTAEDVTGTDVPAGSYYEAGWTELELINGWVQYSSPSSYASAAFRKVNDMVYLRGIIAGGTVGAIIAHLPPGYRPPTYHHVPIVSNSAFGHIRIGPAGDILAQSGNNAWYALNGVVFGATP